MTMADADRELLACLQEGILNPKVISKAIEKAISRLTSSPKDAAQEKASIEAEVRKLTKEVDVL